MESTVKELVDNYATLDDYKRSLKLQNVLDSIYSKKPESVRFIDAILTFDELSNANIYHVQLLHSVDNVQDAITCFNRSVKKLCEFSFIASSGDCATRFLIVSHLSPLCFEKLLTKRFDKFRNYNLFNIIF